MPQIFLMHKKPSFLTKTSTRSCSLASQLSFDLDFWENPATAVNQRRFRWNKILFFFCLKMFQICDRRYRKTRAALNCKSRTFYRREAQQRCVWTILEKLLTQLDRFSCLLISLDFGSRVKLKWASASFNVNLKKSKHCCLILCNIEQECLLKTTTEIPSVKSKTHLSCKLKL